MSHSKTEKEQQKLVQEKCQNMLNEMLRDEDNRYCVDCDAKGPRWASWNLGLFLCIRCAGIHRNLGVHISKVKSVNLDTWTPEQVVSMTMMGNSRGRAVYEANLPDNFRRPQTDVSLENFIRAKYEHKKYIAKEFVPPTVGRVDWSAEIDDMIAKNKKKAVTNNVVPFPKLAIPPPGASKSEKSKSENNKKVTSNKPATSEGESDVNVSQTNGTTTTAEKNKNEDILCGDLADLVVDNGTNNSQVQGEPVPAQSNASLLGDILQSSSEQQPLQKMTKESILSLYTSNQQQQASQAATPQLAQLNQQFNTPHSQQLFNQLNQQFTQPMQQQYNQLNPAPQSQPGLNQCNQHQQINQFSMGQGLAINQFNQHPQHQLNQFNLPQQQLNISNQQFPQSNHNPFLQNSGANFLMAQSQPPSNHMQIQIPNPLKQPQQNLFWGGGSN